MINRREALWATVLALLVKRVAKAAVIAGHMPWRAGEASPPKPVEGGGWRFFTPSEAAAMEALADRIIPPDPQTVGGKDAGCAVFIDRELAGPYGHQAGLYRSPPFTKGVEQQGPQSADGPALSYRKALAALDRHCESVAGGKTFAQLPPDRQDRTLTDLESGTFELSGVDGKAFFKTLVKDVQMGFFADPIYGGNRDMCGWKMIGFPGAHYDYRDWVERHNERYPHPPVSISGRPEWTTQRS